MAFIGFDVYGTLVDPLGMDAPLREHVGDLAERFAAIWRERQIDWTFRRALMGRYEDFDVVTRDAFRATSAILGADLRTAEAGLLDTYRRLPAFGDAHDGLAQLAGAGHRLVAFSNGAAKAISPPSSGTDNTILRRLLSSPAAFASSASFLARTRSCFRSDGSVSAAEWERVAKLRASRTATSEGFSA